MENLEHQRLRFLLLCFLIILHCFVILCRADDHGGQRHQRPPSLGQRITALAIRQSDTVRPEQATPIKILSPIILPSLSLTPSTPQRRRPAYFVRGVFFASKLRRESTVDSSLSSSMEDSKEKSASWLSVPQFGDWDQKGVVPDYSVDFSKIREMRKQNKRDVSRASLGNEEELINPTAPVNTAAHSDDHHFDQNNSTSARRSFLSYFNCCVKA
ncbi:hypothetical protein Nepgr_026973 [Nepenthes gracilis]|uniref:RIN4 pathogenic type III effector avirulence factor Avr cleavage site domain-containing protein n=1 Tax=Nepenthes gracilis TaxID=150966 RepID=A0AAD3T7U8_NEPGR|nr:hypothetical protein Nepgr_026973 [Nepenthes gracilis]